MTGVQTCALPISAELSFSRFLPNILTRFIRLPSCPRRDNHGVSVLKPQGGQCPGPHHKGAGRGPGGCVLRHPRSWIEFNDFPGRGEGGEAMRGRRRRAQLRTNQDLLDKLWRTHSRSLQKLISKSICNPRRLAGSSKHKSVHNRSRSSIECLKIARTDRRSARNTSPRDRR